MANTDIKGVIFDYGGTIDSRGVHWSEIIWDGYKKAQVPVDKQQFRDCYVFAERELAKTRHILPEHNFLDLLRIKMNIELQNLADNDLLPKACPVIEKAEEIAQYCYQAAKESIEEARPTLEFVHDRMPMVLVSNFYGNVETVLADFGLLHFFKKIVESAVVGVRKPDPKIFELGVNALGLKPEEVLVVGDSYKKDIQPALTLGCRTAWLKGKGWTAEEDAVTHPCQISRLEEIKKYFI